MNYKLLFSLLITTMVSLSLNATYASSSRDEEERRTYPSDKKRKVATLEVDKERKGDTLETDKENQKNINIQTKKQHLPKPKGRSSTHRSNELLLSKLKKEVNGLTRKIEEAYTNASKMNLYESYNAFNALKYEEQTWYDLGQEMKAERWETQKSWKEIVGGQLFFPASRIHQYQESFRSEHLLQRSDILHGCIFAATFRHPLGFFYTTHILWTINRFDDDLQADMEQNKQNFYTRTMAQTCRELETLLDRPDVCYALGQGYFLPTSLTRNYVNMKGIDYYKKGNDLKNQCEFLITKRRAKEGLESIIDDFLNLAQQGYLPAYLEAAEYASDTKQRDRAKLILEEATQKGYPVAWIELAYWYKKNKQLDKYQECLEHAVRAELPRALILQGFGFLGHEIQRIEREKLKKVPTENIKQAAAAFLKAGQLHDPRGFEYLADLKFELSKISTIPEAAEALKAEAYEAIKQGCALGWVKSFRKLNRFASGEEYEEVLRKYGPAPDNFIGALENFLNENTKTELPH